MPMRAEEGDHGAAGAVGDAKFLATHFQYFSVPWDLGPRKTKEILWQQRFLDAREALALGLVNQVVPRAELETATQALAERIAEMDPLLARMIKLSVNQMQDAMGFTASIRAAFSNFMVAQLGGTIGGRARAPGAPRRLPGVARALENERRDRPP
jgi:hypothetical protein